MWGKKSTRKHKKWEGDGLLRVGPSTVLLIDEEGKELGKGSGYNTSQLAELEDGGRCVDHFTFTRLETDVHLRLAVGGKEVEVTGESTEKAWQLAKKETRAMYERMKENLAKNSKPNEVQPIADPSTRSDTIKATSSPVNFKPFCVPARVGSTLPQFTAARAVAPGKPMFDCNSPGAIVMPSPPPGHPLRREAGLVEVIAHNMQAILAIVIS